MTARPQDTYGASRPRRAPLPTRPILLFRSFPGAYFSFRRAVKFDIFNDIQLLEIHHACIAAKVRQVTQNSNSRIRIQYRLSFSPKQIYPNPFSRDLQTTKIRNSSIRRIIFGSRQQPPALEPSSAETRCHTPFDRRSIQFSRFKRYYEISKQNQAALNQ
ncbi:hypothetical protein [Burkholderia stabilis]|uniref:hypothetical protein n=1 Tax=Burkholderia stabilis TaxID=95485 RepID=UPI001F4AF5BA|nr:hypothetical protein [Burkholderia stabilis]